MPKACECCQRAYDYQTMACRACRLICWSRHRRGQDMTIPPPDSEIDEVAFLLMPLDEKDRAGMTPDLLLTQDLVGFEGLMGDGTLRRKLDLPAPEDPRMD